jgi:ribosomal protein S12 methylthiotransferase rimO
LISKDTPLSPGSFYQVKVIDAQAFDLYGKVLN